MKLFQKRWFAVVVAVLLIAAAIGISRARLGGGDYTPESASTAQKWGEEHADAYTGFAQIRKRLDIASYPPSRAFIISRRILRAIFECGNSRISADGKCAFGKIMAQKPPFGKCSSRAFGKVAHAIYSLSRVASHSVQRIQRAES